MKKNKLNKSEKKKAEKQVISIPANSDKNLTPIWKFDLIDKSGPFAFCYEDDCFNHKEILIKLINYGNMTWSEIKQQTHDKNNRSKHHFLDVKGLSKEAKERIRIKGLEEETDSIFSFALQNKLRIIGILRNAEFHIVWYDPEHKFFPSKK